MHSLNNQRGLTLIGLILLAIILGSIAVIGAQVVPSASEYLSIKRTVKQAVTNGGSPTEIRRNFDKIKSVNYIESISGQDIQITQSNGKTIASFSYEKEIHLLGPAYLLLKYEGNVNSSSY